MHENPERESENEVALAPPKRVGAFLLKAGLVVAFLGLVVAFLLPNVRFSREAGRRASCANGMRQIALAMLNYHDANGQFPPAYTTDENGKPLHSWRTLILPYLEQGELFKSIDLMKPWDDPVNAAAFRTVVEVYCCPSRENEYDNTTTYLAVVTPESCMQPAESRKLVEIVDGTKQTLMVIEADETHAVPWMQPADADEKVVLGLGENSELAHSSGTHAAFADGLVHYLSSDVPAAQRRAMISIAGRVGEVLRESLD